MAEKDGQERTEEPTEKKKKDSREKGQVARSRELNSAALMIVGGLVFMGMGGQTAMGITEILGQNFKLSRADIFDPTTPMAFLGASLEQSFTILIPIMIALVVVAIIAPCAIGGFTFSWKAAAPKWNKMSPAKGFKRMFGTNALMELVKSIAKFAVVGGFAAFYLSGQFNTFMGLGHGSLETELAHGLTLLGQSFLVIALSLLIIVAIDVPYQLWNHKRQLKMTKQEVKDENKNTEGKPEVKGRIRQQQMQLSYRRMMSEVPKADVVITNPEHFSVALKYNDSLVAPVVVAKGVDHVAMKIREVAVRHDIPIFAAPPLARAIYYNTKIDQAIPEGLYLAVAQVLAYVFQLQEFRNGKASKPSKVSDLEIPDELKR